MRLLALRAALGHDFLFFWLNWIEAQARKLHNSFIQHGDKQPDFFIFFLYSINARILKYQYFKRSRGQKFQNK